MSSPLPHPTLQNCLESIKSYAEQSRNAKAAMDTAFNAWKQARFLLCLAL